MKTNKLSIIKSIYNQSIGYVLDKSNWESITTPYELFCQFRMGHKAKKMSMKIGNELKIFSSASIEILESLYYHSVDYVFEPSNWVAEMLPPTTPNEQFNVASNAKNSLRQFGNDLLIFSTFNIDLLETLYYKSIGYVFENNRWVVKNE